ncbi:DUF3078 domain-containing protein [Psychroserpens sp.]|uniref:DUF3078 domain-containing protein n=1 Tax=Psychroserpens sp. TaxID=2020870 RepID=UPI001B1D0227|nr:DUF3078 domain-containing protein [Psychroserpens sp.]MBO6605207.1 DUF3078 domain-containing protein [Psychroserpens sp.]MBO6630159.1 DUF3078 domain-containing protein [Psychroserpens sp.]MBO6653984.1 DUF3078 domain-containing protein [Psychroserpens sp.]MBO6682305.1 DUF3078 domain-containing protein [Psychroserpens sp.]MBO6748581.1 DUF3078 domain-containing protein [Psychroserpens sp.]
MTRKLLLAAILMLSVSLGYSQTKEELEAQKAEKQAEADAAQAEADAIQAQIDALPGWRVGAFGVIGGSLSEFNNWYAQGAPNNASGSIGFTVNGFANLIEEKFFWRNALTTNLNWTKLDNKDISTDSEDFEPTTDVFNLSSLYGRNITAKLAVSGLMEYRTTLLNNFNDPGYLDVGVGATWTPVENLIVVIHPLNYNFVFADNDAVFESSLGAKIVADYTRSIGKVNFKTNLSMFQSYKTSDLSNWTWTNSFSYTFWKNIGVGFDFGLRNNKQEALNFALSQFDPMSGGATPTFDNVDNDLQTYYTVGLTYKF